MEKRKKCYLNLPEFAFFSKIFLVLLTIYDSADGNSFLQFLEVASSGASKNCSKSVWNIPGLPESGCIPVKDGACRRDIREIWRALRTRP